MAGAIGVGLLIGMGGCQTDTPDFPELTNRDAPKVGGPDEPKVVKSDSIVLREGDVVKITFPGALNLNTSQPIRRDGKIALQLVGEFKAAGMTPTDMEKELIKLYGPQLQTKEVSVTVESSAFPVYVTGAVLRPGKILSDRPLTALEAIMEAGGFDYAKANLKKVTVIRHENERTEHYKLNLKGVLQGEQNEQFNLKPSDIIYVPERFNWF
jgi:polysaccharide export outer membrane protein